MQYTPQELDQMNLRQLASMRPTNAEDEQLLQLKFELRAHTSTIEELRAVDVEFGWQEKILAPIIEERMLHIPQDNDPVLSPEDQALLDNQFLTKDQELALQAKLDAANRRKKVHLTQEEPVNVLPDEEKQTEETQMTVDDGIAAVEEEKPVKKTRKTKKTE